MPKPVSLLPNRAILKYKKLLDEVKHPEFDLWLYNYTSLAMFSQAWNEYPELRYARGLIVNSEGDIVARPFPKFHNIEEYGEDSQLGILPPYKSFDVYEKVDGSLGILYCWQGKTYVATRGSFNSEQALRATAMLHDMYPAFCEDYALLNEHPYNGVTVLVEIIYPENRIVVDYKGASDLWLLAAYANNNGVELSRNYIEMMHDKYEFPIVAQYSGFDFNNIRDKVRYKGGEGFVIRFDTGLRVKLKYAEYTRLHKIVTGVSNRSIWEALKSNQSIDDIITNVPDEFYQFVVSTKSKLESQRQFLREEANKYYLQCLGLPDRKSRCEFLSADPARERVSSLVLNMLSIEDRLWDMVEPKFYKPFSVDADA